MLSVAVAISLSTTSSIVSSLGVGNNTAVGILNRPLSVELPIIAESFDLHDLKANLADDQQHERFGLTFPTWMPKLNFETVNTQRGPILRVTTYQPIKEPIVNFVLQIKYKQVLLFKEITLFLDPVEMVNNNLTSNIPLTSNTTKIANTEKPYQSAPPTSQINSEATFRVERGQSLWKIAKNWDVKNASLNQKMQAIFLTNQDAFINGDKNKLKQGAVISLSSDALNLVITKNSNTTEYTVNKSQSINLAVDTTDNSLTASNNLTNKQESPLSLQQEPATQPANTSTRIENELTQLKSTIAEQEILNLTLKAELERLEQQIELKEQLIQAQLRATQTLTSLNNLAETSSAASSSQSPSINPENLTESSDSETTPSDTNNNTQALPPLSIDTDNLSFSESENIVKTNSPINLWLTAIWFGLAIIIAYLGTIISGKRNAKRFAKKLDYRLQDLAYNKQRQLSQTPSIKELSIPKNLSPSVQVKYLNSAADFYIRCHRHDLAKELVNEGLIQFRGNSQIIDALNQIRKRIFNHLDNDIHAHIIEKLDARVAQSKADAKMKDDNIIDIDEFNSEWLKKWDKKVS